VKRRKSESVEKKINKKRLRKDDDLEEYKTKDNNSELRKKMKKKIKIQTNVRKKKLF
jgi:hypothetical protein